MQIKFLKAVTLVELLVVLTILGVVAALTIPGLSKHAQKTEYAKLAQKGYIALEQGIDLIEINTGESISKIANKNVASLLISNYISKYHTSALYCNSLKTKTECFAGYREFKSESATTPTVRSMMLPSGIVIAGKNSGPPARFYIDVNGLSEPNMEGVDVFIFDLDMFNAKCETDRTNGSYKLCPFGHAKNLMEDNWTITYW